MCSVYPGKSKCCEKGWSGVISYLSKMRNAVRLLFISRCPAVWVRSYISRNSPFNFKKISTGAATVVLKNANLIRNTLFYNKCQGMQSSRLHYLTTLTEREEEVTIPTNEFFNYSLQRGCYQKSSEKQIKPWIEIHWWDFNDIKKCIFWSALLLPKSA